jgi:hypothetical protein
VMTKDQGEPKVWHLLSVEPTGAIWEMLPGKHWRNSWSCWFKAARPLNTS